MQILVSNDDGIKSPWLWALVKELKQIADVVVSAPDGERSAIGTAVTLRQTLRVNEVVPEVPGVIAYSVDGTPSDAVILALGKLAHGKIDLVVSGINQDLNLGEDTHISGTVGAALQGYLRGFPALAVSMEFRNGQGPVSAARIAALIAKGIVEAPAEPNLFLNVNIPDRPQTEMRGALITRLAHRSHINTVEEGNDGRGKYYCLVRQMTNNAVAEDTDVWAVTHGNISITPIYTSFHRRPPLRTIERICDGLLKELGLMKPQPAKTVSR
ncbi:MAG: 5'/3'-nucleotidase SurE [Dehalococcoidales bacterium]|nr:5'/3'-nucleotidase SurE [Dehalococcoidales bacterium]